ncbi:SPOR domain-containing protein [Ferruginibacter paludis]|uniref:SPOR domain-containing protein n=1 Tax=Ferruginibacter paludis TaxID=1310417 RepID=UPI0025B2F7F6|nr:SPOR domain-containing protein [Ferruginibacter paludis]MDN3654750.1 SPOR domain-containing protein [Ferruginibacter paludis]
MKKIVILLLLAFFVLSAGAQVTAVTDTANQGKITVFKDPRLDILAKKEAAFNEANGFSLGPRSAKGYRLMLLSTSDRPAAMRVRSQLLERFPEQKVYMSFQPPYIKLRFGNFLEKADAEKYKKEIIRSKLVTNNIYLLPETIEVKPDKDKESN